MGQFKSELSVAERKVVAQVSVVIGFSSATDLGVLHVGTVTTPIAENCNTVGDTYEENLKAKFPSVFNGIGKLKDFQLKLHVNPRLIPVVQNMRRVPFSLKDKVTAKVNEHREKRYY